MTNPALCMGASGSSTRLPSRSTLMRFEAVTSSNSNPKRLTGLARNARRNVGIDQIGPAEMLDQPVARREVDALLPFGGIDVRLCGAADGGCDRRHSRLLDLFSRPLSRDVRAKPIHSAELHSTSAAAPPPGRGSDRRMSARRSAA